MLYSVGAGSPVRPPRRSGLGHRGDQGANSRSFSHGSYSYKVAVLVIDNEAYEVVSSSAAFQARTVSP